MPDEQTTKTDTAGKEADPPVETPKTDSQILKEENDALAFELKRKQTIRNEALLAGTAGGRVEPEPEKVLSDEEYANKFMKGEVNPMKDDDISIN